MVANVQMEKTKNAGPRIRELTRAEIDALLARNNVGRIAYAFKDRVDIEPINYVYKDGWVYCRTSEGSKFETIEHHRWVAFEVDEVQGLFDWQSVVVRGSTYVLRGDSPDDERKAFTPGLELLKQLMPGTLEGAGNDPVPFRQIVFRIHLDEVTGREAKSATS
ncbi:MAG: pyridoxamine 5'-phosphate oxidase family protein [Gemmatimonadota bacterium]|nr:pyridoxamine 5'-phosphate oxidase family protein [Gemmatimonadota bacterium]